MNITRNYLLALALMCIALTDKHVAMCASPIPPIVTTNANTSYAFYTNANGQFGTIIAQEIGNTNEPNRLYITHHGNGRISGWVFAGDRMKYGIGHSFDKYGRITRETSYYEGKRDGPECVYGYESNLVNVVITMYRRGVAEPVSRTNTYSDAVWFTTNQQIDIKLDLKSDQQPKK